MADLEIARKDLDNQQFMNLRQSTEKIVSILGKRLKSHLDVLKPIFMPRKLLGTFVKSALKDEIIGSNKAFAELQKCYAAVCEKPFGLPKKLQAPLAPISGQLDAVPFKYSILLGESKDKPITVTAASRWIVSYRSECPFSRLKAMIAGDETRQTEDMKQSLIDHLALVVFLKKFPALGQLLNDLRYDVEVVKLDDLGGLPVVTLKASISTFLPPNDFILQVTQLSGIPAFQEIIDMEALEIIPDPLKNELLVAIEK